jgi:hypothetical protein
LAGTGKLLLPRTIGQQAIVADAHEAGRQDMEEKATEKLRRWEFHHFGGSASGVVGVAKPHDPVPHEDQARIGDGDAMSVAAEILQYLLGTTPRRFGVDHPGFGIELLP